MNLHEYQGKQILKSFGVGIQEGIVAESPEKAVEAAKELTKSTGTQWWVVKAQIHAGGRGKGGGVKLAKNLDELKEKSERWHESSNSFTTWKRAFNFRLAARSRLSNVAKQSRS
mgnify:CR=1 FL=1